MEKAKASNLQFLREEFKRRGKELEESFVAKLNPQEKTTYKETLTFDWIPVGILASLWEKGSQILYPGDLKASLRRLGSETMRCHLKGIYKVAIHITGIPYIIERSAHVWGTFHDTGTAKCEKKDKNELVFIISDYPNLPPAFQETVAGSTTAIIETGGGKDAKVSYSKRADGSHTWIASWN